MRDIKDLPKHFLVITQDDTFNEKLASYLLQEWPDAVLESQTPVNHAMPDEDFAWSAYDILFLDNDMEVDGEVLDWLRDMRGYPFFPVTILLSTKSGTDVAVQSIKAGADDYLPKNELSWAALYAAVVDAILYSKSARAEEMRLQRIVLGPQIENIHIDYKLNQGGFSALYLGTYESERGKKQVVVKTLLLDKALEAAHITRFKKEADLLQQIDSKYVAKLISHGECDGGLYIVTEYFSGGSLRDRMQKQPIRIQDAMHYLIQLATALSVLHKQGIVHRDVKPSNLVLTEDNNLVLIDFGIASEMGVDSGVTMPGEVLGTPSYMSPEHGSSEGVDHRSDIYSMGVIFYEMLSGKKPYQGSTAVSVVYQHSAMPIPRLPYKYQQYQSLLERMMAKKPEERFQSCKDVVEAIKSPLF